MEMENNLDINMMRLIKNMQDKYTPEYFEELSKNSYKGDKQPNIYLGRN